jgi:hypothetical protein
MGPTRPTPVKGKGPVELTVPSDRVSSTYPRTAMSLSTVALGVDPDHLLADGTLQAASIHRLVDPRRVEEGGRPTPTIPLTLVYEVHHASPAGEDQLIAVVLPRQRALEEGDHQVLLLLDAWIETAAAGLGHRVLGEHDVVAVDLRLEIEDGATVVDDHVPPVDPHGDRGVGREGKIVAALRYACRPKPMPDRPACRVAGPAGGGSGR